MKTIALIAHDQKKAEMLEIVGQHLDTLKQFHLVATRTTGTLINDTYGLGVETMMSGPLGGDQQIGARIVEGKVDIIIFFSDPLTAQPHDPDVKALLRIAQVYDIPMANNRATADFLITSPLMEEEYSHTVINFQETVAERAETMGKDVKL